MEQTAKPRDRRVIRTKRAIRNAFARLLSEKNVNDVTIREITELADINRKTFYNYYSGIYQLVDEIENGIVRDFEGLLEDSDVQRTMENPYQVFRKLAQLLNSDLEFYGPLFSDDNNGLTVKIVSLLKQRARDAICQQLGSDPDTVDVALEFTFSGMLAVFRRWFNSGRRESVEEMSALVSTLCFRGVDALMEKK